MIRRGPPRNLAAMNTHIHFDIGSSALGQVLVALNDKGICAILPGDSAAAVKRDLGERFPRAQLEHDPARLARVLPKVVAFVDGRSAALDVPLDPAGTAFQQRVWRALRGIPSRHTADYADIARRNDPPKTFRPVGAAFGPTS